MNGKLMSIDDLYKFCLSNKVNHFDCNDSNYEISVQMNGTALFKNEDEDKHKEGLRPFTAKAYHDHINLNKSKIETDAFKEGTKSAPFRPILAHVVENEDGELDYGAHDFTIEKDEDGNERIVYHEQPVGVIGTEYTIEYDEEDEVNRAILHGYLYEEYCPDAVEILERRGNVDCSIELNIRSFSFDAADKVLVLDDFYIEGLTLLGANHAPGMKGSNVVLDNFSAENNSVFSHIDTNEKLIETLEKLNNTLLKFNIDDESKEGGQKMDKKFEELLEKYGKTAEDVDFDYKDMTEEELEAKFEELFGEDASSDDSASSSDDGEGESNPDEGSEDDEGEGSGDDENFSKFSVEFNGKSYTFELSLSEKQGALYELVNATYGESDNTWYGVDVYETYLIMVDYWSNAAYKQTYKQDGDNFSLTGDRVAVHSRWLTEEEEAALDEMKSNYSTIETELNKYKKAEQDAEKEKVFADENYTQFLDTDEFKSLKENMEKYSIDELKDKAAIAFANCVKNAGTFSAEHKDSKTTRVKFASTKKEKAKNPYGNIFNRNK